MSNRTILLALGAALLLGGVAYLVQHNAADPESDAARTLSEGRVPIEAQFPGKVVYTLSEVADTRPFAADCAARGGTLNECGSPCPPGSTECMDVCAVTCEGTPGGLSR